MPKKSQKFKRRMQGTGSVYLRSDSQHRRKPWVAIIKHGLKEGGKQDATFIGSFASKKEALDALDAFRLRKTIPTATTITVGQVWERIVSEHERAHRPLSRNYIGMWKNHISSIASMRISDVKAFHLQSLVDASGLSGCTQQRFATVFHMIYDYAIANDLATKDYSRYVHYDPVQKSTLHRAFSAEEMRILWQHTDLDTVKVVLIQCYTGMRATELATIEVGNVHLADRFMTGGMKTAAGRNRTIPIAECIFPFVQYFYTISSFQKFPYLVMPDVKRNLYNNKGHLQLYNVYQSLESLGIHNHKSHDARHTFVTIADNYKMPETIQKLIVGHSLSGDITKSVYTHKMLSQLLDAVNSLPYGPDMDIMPGQKKAKIGSQVVV